MRKIEKEILAIEQKDIGHACMIAKAAGYDIIVYDGDGENGMCAPSVDFVRRSNYDSNTYRKPD